MDCDSGDSKPRQTKTPSRPATASTSYRSTPLQSRPRSRGSVSRDSESGNSQCTGRKEVPTPVPSTERKEVKDLGVYGQTDWNDIFKDPEQRQDPALLERFWAEMKVRLVRKFGTISVAFRALDNSGDGELTFLEFGGMLSSLHVTLEQRISRAIFEQASMGDRSLSMKELQTLVMAKTINKLRTLMVECNAKQHRHKERIHLFLSRVHLAGAASSTSVVTRFQQKLTVAFCRQTWEMLKRVARTLSRKLGDCTASAEWTRVAFRQNMLDMLRSAALARSAESVDDSNAPRHGATVQSYEITFMLRIFDRISVHTGDAVTTNDIIVSLVFLSPDLDRHSKFILLFELFDTDFDNGLSFDDISKLFQCICSKRPVFVEDARGVEDMSFQKGLSEQEGQHAFEIMQWTLLRKFHVEGGIVSRQELWDALQTNREILITLLPCSPKMSWAMERSALERDADLALEAEANVTKSRDGNRARPKTRIPSGNSVASTPSANRASSNLAREKYLSGDSALTATPSVNRPASAPVPSNTSTTDDGDNLWGKAEYRSLVAQKFQQSLQGFSDRRNAEQVAGVTVAAPLKPATVGSRLTRPCSAGSLVRVRPDEKHQKSLSVGRGSQSQGAFAKPELPERIATQHLGKEAIFRFRVFESVTLLPRANMGRTEGEATQSYSCQCCNHQHDFRRARVR